MEIFDDLRAVDRIAKWAVARNTWLADPWWAYEEARAAVLELIANAYNSGGDLTDRDLTLAAKRAVHRLGDEHQKDRGLNARKFWDITHTAPSPEGRVVERLALREVFDVQPAANQELLLTLACHGSATAAARHLGLPVKAMYKRLAKARQAFIETWFDWECPPPLAPVPRARGQRLATHCGRGHEFTPENTGHSRSHVRKKGQQQRHQPRVTNRWCRTCAKENNDRAAARRRAAATPEGIATCPS